MNHINFITKPSVPGRNGQGLALVATGIVMHGRPWFAKLHVAVVQRS